MGTLDFGFAVPSILCRKLLVWILSPIRFLPHNSLLICFDPPLSIPLQANCWSFPLNSSVNSLNCLPKHLLEVSEDARIRPSSIVRVVSSEKLALTPAIQLVPTVSSHCAIAFWAITQRIWAVTATDWHVKWVGLPLDSCYQYISTKLAQTTSTISTITWAQRAAATGMAEAAVAMAAASPSRERLWLPPSVACPVRASLSG